jgi:hypothetical protein
MTISLSIKNYVSNDKWSPISTVFIGGLEMRIVGGQYVVFRVGDF